MEVGEEEEGEFKEDEEEEGEEEKGGQKVYTTVGIKTLQFRA